MFDIIGKRYLYFAISLIVVIPGIIAMALWGIPRSIDFTGGTVYDVVFAADAPVSEEALRQVYLALEYPEPHVVEAEMEDRQRFQIRSAEVSPEGKTALDAALRAEFGEYEELSFAAAGSSVGRQVTRNAAIAVALAALAICGYLTIMFRNVSNPLRYGVCAIAAMLHDVLLVLGLAAIVGRFLGWEVDALFLTALLTVIGFSVHDSIVVFDRIRENSGKMRGHAYERIVNASVVQTLDRSINTQLTALFTLVSIFVFSEGQLQRFVFWMIIGLISGTYSSIFNAAPLLVVWHNREWERWFGARPAQSTT